MPTVDLTRTRTVLLRDRVELDRLHLAWHTVPQFHPDDATLTLAADLLARGRSSRIVKPFSRLRVVVREQEEA